MVIKSRIARIEALEKRTNPDTLILYVPHQLEVGIPKDYIMRREFVGNTVTDTILTWAEYEAEIAESKDIITIGEKDET